MALGALWNVGWGFTQRCNMNCTFCYSKNVRKDLSKPPDADYKLHLDFVRLNADKINSINWGTSENSLSPEWFDLIDGISAINSDIVQGVTTNGHLSIACEKTDRTLSTVRSVIKDVDVSIDFADVERHDFLRGCSGAHRHAVNTLELCKELGIPRSIVMIGLADTLAIDNLEGLMELANRYEANLRINIYRPIGNRLDPVSYFVFKVAIRHLVKHHHVVSLADPLFAATMGLSAPDPSGWNSVRILPCGSITPSTYLVSKEWIAGNLFEETIQLDRLPDQVPFQTIKGAPLPPECKGCPAENSCSGGAKDRRVLWYGTLNVRDPYCPFRYEEELLWEEPDQIQYAEKNGPLIHDGYLPTLIFAP